MQQVWGHRPVIWLPYVLGIPLRMLSYLCIEAGDRREEPKVGSRQVSLPRKLRANHYSPCSRWGGGATGQQWLPFDLRRSIVSRRSQRSSGGEASKRLPEMRLLKSRIPKLKVSKLRLPKPGRKTLPTGGVATCSLLAERRLY